jgi:enoyl-CoA hydratase
MGIAGLFARRNLLKATAVLGGLSILPERTASAQADQRNSDGRVEGRPDEVRLADIPPNSTAKITVERRGQIVLIGINRPYIHNRVDPETFLGLAKAYYQYDHDPSLRAAVLFGHGDDFSRGIDVDAFQAAVTSDRPRITEPGAIDPWPGRRPSSQSRSSPLSMATPGTWATNSTSPNTRFGQDENTHGRFPGGGATIRFVREAGWGNAMRYMLTGDHWSAEEALRMRLLQEIAPTRDKALETGMKMAEKIAACGPLGIKTTLASAHLAIDSSQADALSKLTAQYGTLYRTDDFKEGRRAEAEGRPPIYQGK